MAFQNPYASLLQDHSSFVLDEPNTAAYRGVWESFFTKRMGRVPEQVILEVGCSNAEFLTSIAAAHPSLAFIGMDWKFKVLYKGAKRVDSQKLLNVSLLRTKAQHLPRIFGENELDEIWIFFPDPWAKKTQLKHRLIQEEFMGNAYRALKPGGKIYFKTDHPGYMQWVFSLFGEVLPQFPEYQSEDPSERSYRARQIKVRRLEKLEDLISPNEKVRSQFRLANVSLDYWASTQPRAQTLFSTTQTLFEKGFVRDQLPIYYAEFHKL